MKDNLIKRVIGGLGYFGIIIGFLALRMVSVRFFDALIMVFAVISAIEITNALNARKNKPEFAAISARDVGECNLYFVLLALVLGYVGFVFFGLYIYLMGIIVAIGALFIFKLFNKNISMSDCRATVFGMIYPNALFGFALQLNSLSDAAKVANAALSAGSLLSGLTCIALLLLISSGSDIFALFFGLSFGKKIPKKLCPKISPKKTVIGAVGGLVGGIIGSLIVFIFCYFGGFGLKLFPISVGGNIAVFVAAGVLGSLLTQIGDLVASLVKRICGIKDFGYIMLGHGGIMDRWDGVLFNAVALFTFLSVFDLFTNWTAMF